VAVIQEQKVQEHAGTPAQEDKLLIGLGKYANLTFKDILYERKDKDRKG